MAIFTPLDLSPLVGYETRPANIFSDGGITLATDGQLVQQLNDLSGNGWHLTQTTAGNKWTYRAPILGETLGALISPDTVRFMNNTGYTGCNAATTFHIFAMYEENKGKSFNFLTGGAATPNFYYLDVDYQAQDEFNNSTSQLQGTSARCFLHEFVYNGALATNALRYQHYTNGFNIGGSFIATTPSALSALNGIQIGRLTIGFNGAFRLLWVFPAPLSLENRLKMVAYCQRIETEGARKFVTCLGDSLTNGSIQQQPLDYPAQLATALGTGWHVSNNGWFGTRLETLWIGAGLQTAQNYLPGGHPVDAEVILLGTNDLNFARTAAQVEGDLTTFWAARRAAGKAIVAVKIPPSTALVGAEETARVAVNAWMDANPSLYDAIADASATPLDNPANATYYSDGTHMTPTGYGILAARVQTALALLAVKTADTSPSGPRYPASATLDSSAGTVAFTSPGNIKDGGDNLYATCALVAQTSQRILGSNFGFMIDPTWDIDGILCEVEGKTLLGNVTLTARLSLNGVISAAGITGVIGTSEGQVSFGGLANLWGELPTAALINSGLFSIVLQVESAHTDTISLDGVRVTVAASAPVVPPTPPAPSGGGASAGHGVIFARQVTSGPYPRFRVGGGPSHPAYTIVTSPSAPRIRLDGGAGAPFVRVIP